jgi:hypothetical protein
MSGKAPGAPARRRVAPLGGVVKNGLMVSTLFACTFTIYGVVALVSRFVLGQSGRPALWLLLVATFAVAVVLPPVRRRVERGVNRLVLGERSDAYELMTSVVSRMANTLAVDDVLPRLAEAAARSVRSQRGEVRLWLADGGESRQVWSADGDQAGQFQVDGLGLTVEVQHGGAPVGEIGVDTRTGMAAAGSRMLRELAAPAGLALSTVRLTFELRQRLDQVAALNHQLRASQERMVDARRIEQQRIQAEVNLTVRPRLDAVDAALVAAGESVPDQAGLEAVLAEARAGAVGALDALRSLATGIYPPRLAEAGVVAALEAWAERTGFRLTVRPDGDLDRIRSMPSIEATTYFVCVTVLGDLAGEPGTRPGLLAFADIGESNDGARLVLSVRCLPDRSPALALTPETVQILRDRIDALGGALTIGQPEPTTVTLDSRLPIAEPRGRRVPAAPAAVRPPHPTKESLGP